MKHPCYSRKILFVMSSFCVKMTMTHSFYSVSFFYYCSFFFFLSFGVRDAFQIIFYWWKIFLFHHTNTWYTRKTHKINKFYYLSSNKNETYVVVAKRSTPTKKPAKVRTKQPKSSKKVKFISKYLNIFALIVLLLLLMT